MKFILKLTIGLILIVVSPIMYAQQLKVTTGVENKYESVGKRFVIFGDDEKYVYAINTKDRYFRPSPHVISRYDAGNNYTLSATLEIKFDKASTFKVIYQTIIEDRIYLIAAAKADGNFGYYGAIINKDLSQKPRWNKLFDPNKSAEYWQSGTTGLVYSHGSNEPAYYIENEELFFVGIFAPWYKEFHYFDKDFSILDASEREQESDTPEIEEEKHIIHFKKSVNGVGGNTLNVFLAITGNADQAGQSIYFSIYNKSLSKKIDQGKLSDMPTNYHLREIQSNFFDSNEFTVFGYYYKGEERIPKGFYFLRYNYKTNSVVSEKNTRFTDETETELKESNFFRVWDASFSISRNKISAVKKSGNYVIYHYNNFSSSSAGDNRLFYSDLFIMVLDSTGQMIKKEMFKRDCYEIRDDFIKTSDFTESFLIFDTPDNLYFLYYDNPQNYYQQKGDNEEVPGEYKKDQKPKSTKLHEGAYCLAAITINGIGITERKIISTDIVKETATKPVSISVYKTKNNKYLLMGYDDEVSKIITVSLD